MLTLQQLPSDAQLRVRRNAARLWLVDASGNEYEPPAWLRRLVEHVEDQAGEATRREIRDALALPHDVILRLLSTVPDTVLSQLAAICTQLNAAEEVIISPGSARHAAICRALDCTKSDAGVRR